MTSVPDLRQYRRIVLLTDGHSTPFLAKTAISLLRYRREHIVAVMDRQHEGQTAEQVLGIGDVTPVIGSLDQADADALFVGIAPPGGKLPARWRPIIRDALNRGLDIVSGLHDFLSDDAELVATAQKLDRRLIDVRRNDERSVATCAAFAESCVRIHTVGNDCSLGKMVTSLEIQRGLVQRGLDAGFAATGQTGIMVAGSGVPIDCVVADFVNGAAERLVLDHQDHEFLLIEGQGSISHPLYSAVTLGLLHGSAPDALVFCFEAGREYVKGVDGRKIPPTRELFDAYERLANLRHPCRVIGFAANTRNLTASDARDQMRSVESEFGLPVCDVYRDGPDRLADAAIALKASLK